MTKKWPQSIQELKGLGKLSLHPIEEADLPWLLELHNDPEVLRNLTNPDPVKWEDHLRWFNATLESTKEWRLVAKLNHANVGLAKIISVDWQNKNCLTGLDIDRSYRGKGLAKPIWRLLIDFAFKDLGLHRIALTTAVYNERAKRIYTELGFVYEGLVKESLFREGTYHDQWSMYLNPEVWAKAQSIENHQI